MGVGVGPITWINFGLGLSLGFIVGSVVAWVALGAIVGSVVRKLFEEWESREVERWQLWKKGEWSTGAWSKHRTDDL